MFRENKVYIIVMPGANEPTIHEMKTFLLENKIKAKVVNAPITIHEVKK